MGQAARLGVLASVLLLACNHERVVLGGPGAGGSTVSPVAGRASVPELPSDGLLRPAGPPQSSGPAVIATTSGRTRPPLGDLPSLPQLVPPISGGTLAVAADGSRAVVAEPERDMVYVVDVAALTSSPIALPVHSEPGRVVLDDQGGAHVALRSAGQLARIDLASNALTLSEPICQQPRGLAYSAATRSLFVACADGQLVELSADNHAVLTRRQNQLTDLRDVVITQSGKPVVSRFRSASVLLDGTDSSELTLPELPWPFLDARKSSNDPAVWLTTRATFAFRTLAGSGDSIWVLHERAQLDPLADDDFRGRASHCGPAVQVAMTQLDPTTGEVKSSLQLQGLSVPAIDMALSRSGSWVALASPSADAQGRAAVQVHLLDQLMSEARVEKQVNAEFPHSAVLMCVEPNFRGMTFADQASALAFDVNDVLYVQSRFPAYLHIVKLTVSGAIGRSAPVPAHIATVVLNTPPERDIGHEYFHAELDDSRVSCAACHAEGLDDGHVWQSSKGLRRTPSLRGGLSETAPFAWDGEHVSLDSMIERFTKNPLGAQLSDAAISGIGRWLDKLGPLSLPPSSEEEKRAAASGRVLFESVQLGCSSCHTGPKLTNNQTMDVGTGGAFQVPSLTGLALRAPYMHDGCAKDLGALAGCGGEQHTKLAALSGEQAAELHAYLRSL